MKYNKEVLTQFVKESNSIANVLKLLKLKPAGGNYKTILKKFNEYNIDTSHFLGMGWNKNKKLHQKYSKEEFIKKFLVVNSTYTNTHRLKLKLFEFRLKERKCEKCGQSEIWFGENLSLHLDHINGINNDYRLENLKVLCPNCHSQTSTYCGKNVDKKKYKKHENINYCSCGAQIKNNSTKCQKCHHENLRKVKSRPTYSELINNITFSGGYTATGKKYGVSDNTIRKWLKFYEKQINTSVVQLVE
jgi:Zn finger protein HypA/HybF involved in hydrogenase expression